MYGRVFFVRKRRRISPTTVKGAVKNDSPSYALIRRIRRLIVFRRKFAAAFSGPTKKNIFKNCFYYYSKSVRNKWRYTLCVIKHNCWRSNWRTNNVGTKKTLVQLINKPRYIFVRTIFRYYSAFSIREITQTDKFAFATVNAIKNIIIIWHTRYAVDCAPKGVKSSLSHPDPVLPFGTNIAAAYLVSKYR